MDPINGSKRGMSLMENKSIDSGGVYFKVIFITAIIDTVREGLS
jgi:hypothetical protein